MDSTIYFKTNTPEIVTVNQGKIVGVKVGKGTFTTTDTKTGASQKHSIIVITDEVTWKGNNKVLVG